MSKPRLKNTKRLTQGHTAGKAGFETQVCFDTKAPLFTGPPRIRRLHTLKRKTKLKLNSLQCFILPTENLRPREGKQLPQGHTAVNTPDSWLPECFAPTPTAPELLLCTYHSFGSHGIGMSFLNGPKPWNVQNSATAPLGSKGHQPGRYPSDSRVPFSLLA